MSDPNSIDAAINELGATSASPIALQSHPVRMIGKASPIDDAINEFGSDQEKYGTPLEVGKTALEAGLNTATLGTSAGIEKGIFNNAEEQRKRAEINPYSKMTGQVLGVALPAAVGDEAGLLGLVGKSGGAAAEATGLAAGNAGARIAAKTIHGAVEAGMVQTGDEIAKMLTSDPANKIPPGEAAQTALINILAAGGGGALIGGAFGGVGELWNAKFGSKVGSALNAAHESINGEEPVITPTSEEAITSNTNTAQLAQDAKDLNVPLTKGVLSGDKDLINSEIELSKGEHRVGQNVRQAMIKSRDALSEAGDKLLSERDPNTSIVELGRQAKEDVHQSFSKESADITKGYNEVKPILKKVSVPSNLALDAMEEIQSHEYASEKYPEYKEVAGELVDRIKNIDNLNDLKTERSLIGDELIEANRSGSPKASILKTAKDALTKMRDASLENAKASGLITEEEAGRISNLDSRYRNLKQGLLDFGTESGTGKPNNVNALLERFKNIPDEQFGKRFFDIKDINSINNLKERFPELGERARKVLLNQIYENSLDHSGGKGGVLDPNKLLPQLRQATPEAREALFGSEASKVESLQRLHDAIPKVSSALREKAPWSVWNLADKSGILKEVAAAIKYRGLNATPHLNEAAEMMGGGKAANLAAMKVASSGAPADAFAFKQSVDYVKNLIKGESMLDKATNAVFNGTMAIPSGVVDANRRDSFDKKLANLQSDPSSLMASGGHLDHYMPGHGSAMAQTAATVTTYLNSLRPDLAKRNPLDGTPVASATQKAQFNRALDIAQNPLLVLKSVKNGTVTVQDLTHLKSMYPDLYNRVSSKLSQEMIKSVHSGVKIPYHTKLGLAVILTQPLDSTMTPIGIMSAQPHPAQHQQQQGPAPKSGAHSMKSLSKLSAAYQTPNQARQSSALRH